MIYRRKPKTINAVRWKGNNYDELCALLEGKARCDLYNRCLFLHGSAVNVGEYIVIDGDHVYQIASGVFEDLFEPVE